MFIFSGEPIFSEKGIKWLAPVALIGGWLLWETVMPPDFSDDDIRAVQESIHKEFGKQSDTKVRELSLSRKSRGELIGVVKIEFVALGASHEFSKFCTASKTKDGSVWRCQ